MAWPLIVVGVCMGVAMILLQVKSPMLVAVGMYLPLRHDLGDLRRQGSSAGSPTWPWRQKNFECGAESRRATERRMCSLALAA
jgi:hypothetical protein